MKATKVTISNAQSSVKIPSGTRLLVRRCCNAVLKLEGVDGPAEVSISFIDNLQIKELNNKYRGKDQITDVLSFPLAEGKDFEKNPETGALMIGDVAISLEKADEQAQFYGHSFQREVAFLTVHAMLHLLGYDHEKGGIESMKMREKEEQVLTVLGLSKNASYIMDI